MEKMLAGHYQVLKPLGGGGFGQTFLARDIHLPGQPLCVVKQLKPQVRDEQSWEVAKRLFDREAKILYRLGDCDQIPRLFAHFEQNREFYLVQDYIEGHSLDREIAPERRWTEAKVLAFLQDVLQVLAFVHQQNVIHRDIKPANLIRRARDKKIVLIDFGAVKEVSNQTTYTRLQTSLTVAVGSPGYMPSEQASFKPQFSSDIYAIGMICLQAFTGLSPQELPQDSQGEYSCILLGDRLSISLGLATILDKMVRYDYRQRYANATETWEAISQLKQPSKVDYHTSTILIPSQSLTPTPVGLSEPIETNLEKTLPTEFTPQLPSVNSRSRQAYRHRNILLNKVKNYWIKGVLETSLHDKALIELGLEERLDAVERPWGLTWESSEAPQQKLPRGTRIIDKFNELGEGRSLLILGQPGAGKTTTMLELTRDLIALAETDTAQPMPVVFNLSSWRGHKQSIADWLVRELQVKYQVSKTISKTWVDEQQLLLLLDGLDEVSMQRRDACVNALNQFTQKYGQTEIVVCSRLGDYETLPTRLQLQAAIYLQPLTNEQIQEYLRHTGTELETLRSTLAGDITLQEVAECPLMLNIMTLAYQGMLIEALPNCSLSARRHHLLNTYIERMFNRKGAGIPQGKVQIKQWLSRLAQQMVRESQTVFLIERMQPSWLQTRRQKWIYNLVFILSGILVSGGGAWLIFGVIFSQAGLAINLIQSLVCGLVGGTICILVKNRIEPVEDLVWSWAKIKPNIFLGLRVGLISGALFMLVTWLTVSLIYQSPLRIRDFLPSAIAGLDAGLIIALIRSLQGGSIETSTVPNYGILRSAKFTIMLIFMSAIVWGLMVQFIMGMSFIGGVIAGMILGFFSPAGIACIQHFILRFILYRNREIPWDYARFLDYATQLIFLQKVGGGYIFIHRMLLEHFAEIEQ